MTRARALVGGASLVVLGSMLGFAAAYGLHQSWRFEISRELDLIDLFNLAFTAVIAVFLQRYYSHKSSVEAGERDVLVDLVRQTLSALSTSRRTFFALTRVKAVSQADYLRLKGRFRDLANSMELLERSLDICHPDNKWLVEAKNVYFRYKASVTDPVVPGRPYPSQTHADQERFYRAVSVELMRLIVTINRRGS
jgi:hypothetical protein